MTAQLVRGDHISCSRVGGAMRRESSRLRQHSRSLDDALSSLALSSLSAWEGPDTAAAALSAAMTASVRALQRAADELDEAGAALQRYATDLALGHELGRRAARRVEGAGLLLEGTRVVWPRTSAGTQDGEPKTTEVPEVTEVQSRVDLATAHAGRARSRLKAKLTRLTEGLSACPAGRASPARRATSGAAQALTAQAPDHPT